MKGKTSELTGNALSYTLCMIEMPHLVWGKSIGIHAHSNQIVVPELKEPQCYSPFMDWAQGGLIMEREKILVGYDHDTDTCAAEMYIDDELEMMAWGNGETYLIAAMRCFVASKLGDEVEIPKELT